MKDIFRWYSPELNEVHIWAVDLAKIDPEPSFTSCLSEDEHIKAQRFHFTLHRQRYIIGKAVVRHVLARYLDNDPAELRFQYGPFGKPELKRHGKIATHFNTTHAGDLLICAVGNTPLGVDLEPVALPLESKAIARMYFTPSEVEKLRVLPLPDQPLAFTRCWTRKEAFIKAIGAGLSYPLDSFEVTFAAHEPAGLLRVQDNDITTSQWSILEINTWPDYVGAIAIKYSKPKLRYFCFDDCNRNGTILKNTGLR